MPSKRENLERLLDKNLSKTADQARRESQSISSILQRFGGPVREEEAILPSSDTEEKGAKDQIPVPTFGTPNEGIPIIDIPVNGTPEISMPEFSASIPASSDTVSLIDTPKKGGNKQEILPRFNVDPARGWLALPNDIVDKVLPSLSLPEQAVLIRMYRLSRGFGFEVCTIGYVTLGKLCNITRNTVKTAVKSLISSGLIECLEQGVGADHSTYRVNLPSATVVKSGTPKFGRQKTGTPKMGIPKSGMARNDGTVAIAGMPAIAGIPGNGPIKEINSSKEITHTTQRVGVASRFSLEECRRYADHLKQTGQGITNPGGYATKIYRSGEADALIEAFVSRLSQHDVGKCEDCRGSGFIYIDSANPDKGVRPCKHSSLKQDVQ